MVCIVCTIYAYISKSVQETNWLQACHSLLTGHRFSGGDSPPPELPSSPPPPIGFTGRDSVDNDPVVSS